MGCYHQNYTFGWIICLVSFTAYQSLMVYLCWNHFDNYGLQLQRTYVHLWWPTLMKGMTENQKLYAYISFMQQTLLINSSPTQCAVLVHPCIFLSPLCTLLAGLRIHCQYPLQRNKALHPTKKMFWVWH